MKTKYIWEASDIEPGKRFKDWNHREKMIVCDNLNDGRGPVFNLVDEGWIGRGGWRTKQEMADAINKMEGAPL